MLCDGVMINPDRLTVKAGEALNDALTLARRNGNPVVYDLHLFAALLDQDEGIVVPVLQKLGASVAQLREQVERMLNLMNISELPELDDDPEPSAAEQPPEPPVELPSPQAVVTELEEFLKQLRRQDPGTADGGTTGQ